jgi:hypothetical protein
MTIGIGAFGPNAGQAVFNALRAAERIGSGAIGGFATFAAITEDGRAIFAVTQRGGSSTAFTEGETTGVEPPAEFASARIAGVISSGPDRPGDLTQFIPVDPAVGLVTGHRIPPTRGSNGQPMNADALLRMTAGLSAEEAVRAVITASPEADCGLICISVAGGVASANTARVLSRPDVGQAVRRDIETGATVAVLHNAIRPHQAVADLAAAIAIETMTADLGPKGWITLTAGTPIGMGNENAVFCDAEGRSLRVTTTDPSVGLRGELGAAIYLGSAVYLADRSVGRTIFEPITTIETGKIIAFSGKSALRMSYR